MIDQATWPREEHAGHGRREQGNSFPFAKWTCYDKGLQSGMVVRWPGKVKAGVQTDAMVEYVDVLPTFLDAAGLPSRTIWMDGLFCPCSRATLSLTKQLF